MTKRIGVMVMVVFFVCAMACAEGEGKKGCFLNKIKKSCPAKKESSDEDSKVQSLIEAIKKSRAQQEAGETQQDESTMEKMKGKVKGLFKGGEEEKPAAEEKGGFMNKIKGMMGGGE